MTNKDDLLRKQIAGRFEKLVAEGRTPAQTRKEIKENELICGFKFKSGRLCVNEPKKDEKGEIINGRCEDHYQRGIARDPEARKRQLANLSPFARLIHGARSQKVSLTFEENKLYEEIMGYYTKELDLDMANQMLLDRAIMNYIFTMRKELADEDGVINDDKSYNDSDTKFLRFMQAVGLDRKFNESTSNSHNKQQIDLAQLLGQSPEDE